MEPDRVTQDLRTKDAADDRAARIYARHKKRAREHVLELLFGQETTHPKGSCRNHLCVGNTAEMILDDEKLLGGAGNVDFEDLVNAIIAASKDWEWMIEGKDEYERQPEDMAHRFIWRLARTAALAILAGDTGQAAMEEEVQRLEEDAATEEDATT